MSLKSALEATRNIRMILLHCAIIITLVGVSIWDSVLIIGSFVNDNQLTVVRTENGNDSTEFLENLTIIADYRDSLIPKAWLRELNIQNDQETTAYYDRVRTAMKRRELFVNDVNLSTIDGMITAAAVFSELWYLDWLFVECLGYAQSECSYDETTRNYSYILENGTELEALEEAFFRRMISELIVTDEEFTIHAIRNLSMLYAEINPEKKRYLAPTYKFSIRLIDDSPVYQWDNDTSLYADITFYEKRSLIKKMQFEQKNQYSQVVTVKNIGIYDKSATTLCTSDPEIYSTCGDSLNYNNRDYLKAIVSKCGCLPFTDKKHFRKFKEFVTGEWLPFCDYQKYMDCGAKHGPIRVDADQYLPSCLVVRNEYSVSRTHELCHKDLCPYVEFEIVSSDHSYVVYQDRFQLSTTQLVSQVGGDIGLYTGLSLLSVWQLIVFVYGRHKLYESQHLRKNPKGTKGLKYYKEFLFRLFKEAEENVTLFGCEDERNKKKADITSGEISEISGSELVLSRHSTGDSLEKRMDMVTSEVREMQGRVKTIELKLDEIASLMRNGRE